MLPRGVVKQAFQFVPGSEVPFSFNASSEQEAGLTRHYGDESWRAKVKPYVALLSCIDGFFSRARMDDLPGGLKRDCFGSVWQMGSTHHLAEAPIKGRSLAGYRMPGARAYVRQYMAPLWDDEVDDTTKSIRVATHMFGLFEKAWTLSGFEQTLTDMCDSPEFVEELLDLITDWMLESLDELLKMPVDAVMLTDDYADQRGVIFGLDRFRTMFKPRWKRIFDRIRKAGVYSILHVCGNAEPALPDLIECGLDGLESLQPEAMDVYALKREFGRDLRFWGGLGAQSVLPFGTPDEVRAEVRRLKLELGNGGGYILAGAKGIMEDVPTPNVIAYLEEAVRPRGD